MLLQAVLNKRQPGDFPRKTKHIMSLQDVLNKRQPEDNFKKIPCSCEQEVYRCTISGLFSMQLFDNVFIISIFIRMYYLFSLFW